MKQRELRFRLSWIVLFASLATFISGLVILFCLHVGRGAFAHSALGQSRLFWLNLHRFSAIVLSIGVVGHVALHWRSFCRIIVKVITGRKGKSTRSELLMYLVFTIAAVTAFVAWLVLDGSSRIRGPAFITPGHNRRHFWIDAHHVSSLVALAFVAHHIGHRWRLLIRQPRRSRNAQKLAGTNSPR